MVINDKLLVGAEVAILSCDNIEQTCSFVMPPSSNNSEGILLLKRSSVRPFVLSSVRPSVRHDF